MVAISLEEHVARAIWAPSGAPWAKAGPDGQKRMLDLARAAIAAVREREEVPLDELSAADKNGLSAATTPLPGMGGKTDPAPDIHLRHFVEHIAALHKDGFPNEAESVIHANELRIRESERAACEAIARTKVKKLESPKGRRGSPAWFVARSIADQIAARKGNGEGK